MKIKDLDLLTPEQRKSRCEEAKKDLKRGLSQGRVARKWGVSRTTASRWKRDLSKTGETAISVPDDELMQRL